MELDGEGEEVGFGVALVAPGTRFGENFWCAGTAATATTACGCCGYWPFADQATVTSVPAIAHHELDTAARMWWLWSRDWISGLRRRWMQVCRSKDFSYLFDDRGGFLESWFWRCCEG